MAVVACHAIMSPPRIDGPGARLLFLQARPPLRRADGTKTKPEKKLELLPRPAGILWNEPNPLADGLAVRHATANELRVHNAPLSLYLGAHKEAFFEPRPGTLALYERFNDKVKELVGEWWERIEDSRAYATNLRALKTYHRTLRPGDVTLVGLIAEGGQGMRAGQQRPLPCISRRHAAGPPVGRAGR